MTRESFTVAGMTCQHCAASVTEELTEISGVRAVDVDVLSGLVTVTSKHPLPVESIRAAIDEAGYRLAD